MRARLPRDPTMSVLRRLLSDLWRAPAKEPASAPAPAPIGAPPDPRELFPEIDAHARAPMDVHLDILFGEQRVGAERFEDLMQRAMRTTSVNVPPLKAVRRREAALNLIRYFRHARALEGRWAECGVFAGTSSLALCLAARAESPAFDGSGLHLVDSFEGLSPLGEEDHSAERRADGTTVMVPPPTSPGNFTVPLARVREALAEFPGVAFHKGWIPPVLDALPEARWSLVHVDVDLYEPTRACLEYFYPRMVAGGVIVCDDYGTPAFPGARRAWREFCEDLKLGFVALPTGQSVLIRK